ncbi:MAG: hypothetical protein D6719_02735 [Candidatus Dadabacteria bacterium]|nr:MAG: hypothetical protein D6719_02735 [Candidatus Dadabacteria bacterium]
MIAALTEKLCFAFPLVAAIFFLRIPLEPELLQKYLERLLILILVYLIWLLTLPAIVKVANLKKYKVGKIYRISGWLITLALIILSVFLLQVVYNHFNFRTFLVVANAMACEALTVALKLRNYRLPALLTRFAASSSWGIAGFAVFQNTLYWQTVVLSAGIALVLTTTDIAESVPIPAKSDVKRSRKRQKRNKSAKSIKKKKNLATYLSHPLPVEKLYPAFLFGGPALLVVLYLLKELPERYGFILIAPSTMIPWLTVLHEQKELNETARKSFIYQNRLAVLLFVVIIVVFGIF